MIIHQAVKKFGDDYTIKPRLTIKYVMSDDKIKPENEEFHTLFSVYYIYLAYFKTNKNKNKTILYKTINI